MRRRRKVGHEHVGLINGGGLLVGKQSIRTDRQLRVFPRLNPADGGRQRAVETISLLDVVQGAVAPEQLRAKHVLIGVTAAGLAPAYQKRDLDAEDPNWRLVATQASH